MPFFKDLRWSDGASYSGEFYSEEGRQRGLEQQMHGKGRFVWPDGQTYCGEYRMGKRHGFGKYTWPLNHPTAYGGLTSYEGEFQTDPFGKGTYRWIRNSDQRESTFTGTWEKQQWLFTGTGVWVYKFGGRIEAQIEGRWQDCMPVTGIFTDRDGMKYDVACDFLRLKQTAQYAEGQGYKNHLWQMWETSGDAIFSRKVERGQLAKNPETAQKVRIVQINKADQPGEGFQPSRYAQAIPESDRNEDNMISLNLQAARKGGHLCVVPVTLLAKWTNNFSLERRIGSGAFGDVFEAVDGRAQHLAVKRLLPHVRLQGTSEDREAALKCARREISVLGAFQHPNIIKLLGHTDIGNRTSILTGNIEVCLVYELAPRAGLDLNLKSDDKAVKLTCKVRVQVAAGIARALNYLHCHDPSGPAFHRDVKSANITLMVDFTPKLIDCGLAKYLPKGQQDGTIMTASAARLGTPGYICRKYLDSGKYEFKSEVYSFGVVLLELLTGKLQSNAAEFDLYETYIENEEDIKRDLDVRAGMWNPSLVDGLVDLMHECLAKYAKRIAVMVTIVRRLTDLEATFCPATRDEQQLLKELAEVRHELDAYQAERILADRAVIERKCQVCFDNFPSTAGNVCQEQPAHFLCRICFLKEVEEQISQESRGFFALNGAHIVCRQCLPALVTLADGTVARCVDDDVFARFRVACMEVVEAQVCQEQEARLQKQLANLRSQMGSDHRQERIRQHRLAIAERVLCLCCPRCGQAFVDFAGCFALECSRCKCGFCAYCLEDCGGDAHRHVAGCTFNTAPGREVFGRLEGFVRAQNERRARQLAAYLRDCVPDPAEREAVKEAIQLDLRNLDISLPT